MGKDDASKMDEVLTRMLGTPPKPHDAKEREPGKPSPRPRSQKKEGDKSEADPKAGS